MSFLTAIIYAAITGAAALVHGALGIGFPMVATPLLAMVVDVRTAVLILVIPTLIINLANIIKGGNLSSSIGRYWPMAVFSIFGSLAGAQLLIHFSPDYFRPVLACVLIFYLKSEDLGLDLSWIRRYPYFTMSFFGLGAGLLGGMVNVMLPVLVIYALEVKMPKNVMIQVFNLCFLVGKLTQGAVFASAGLITADILVISLPLAVLGFGIMIFGMGIREKINAPTYRIWLRQLLKVMVIVLVVQFAAQ